MRSSLSLTEASMAIETGRTERKEEEGASKAPMLTIGAAAVLSVAASPDGRQLAAGCLDRRVRVFPLVASDGSKRGSSSFPLPSYLLLLLVVLVRRPRPPPLLPPPRRLVAFLVWTRRDCARLGWLRWSRQAPGVERR